MTGATTLNADVARYVELTLGPRRPSQTELLRRENEALRARAQVMVSTVRTLPAGTTPAEIADLLERLAGIGEH